MPRDNGLGGNRNVGGLCFPTIFFDIAWFGRFLWLVKLVSGECLGLILSDFSRSFYAYFLWLRIGYF